MICDHGDLQRVRLAGRLRTPVDLAVEQSEDPGGVCCFWRY
jgi:hypothetical protein